MKKPVELSPEELNQVNGGLTLQKSTLRSLTVQKTTLSENRIGNVAICSGCHGCTHVQAPVVDRPA